MSLPFRAKMEYTDFRNLVEAFRADNRSLSEAYQCAEVVHRTFCRVDRFEGGFESFKNVYYREKRQGVPVEPLA